MNAQPTTSDHAVTLDPENPWLGLFSYTEATRAYFHGRDEETAELARRVQHKLLTVLFGQSGLGKTSLLRAGLVPRLRREGYCPVYVRIDYAPGSPEPARQIRQAIFRATQEAGHWTRPGASADHDSLWELLHHRGDFLRDAEGRPLTPLLIFDQFEEIFTLGQADDAGKQRAHQFLEDLADLVENRAPRSLEARMEEDDEAAADFDFGRADYRVLITLREDYLAFLESVKDTMPSITQNRMRLARMSGEQALSAVLKPGGKLVTREVAEAIVRFVAGGTELKNAEIEPSLLSLVCRELNTIRQNQQRDEISTDLLAGSRETILSEFYERTLADQPEGVRRVIEDELLTESGFRESVAEERVQKALAGAGATPDALPTLVNRRLLRIEERLDMRRVELTHDVLCKVVLASRNTRREREAREQAERELAEQREREAATHKALVRARLIATVCSVLLVLAIAAAAFGFWSLHRANRAEAQAQASRTHAENLVSFLIEDFYAELQPTGKLKTLGTLAQKTVDYYQTLPPDQVTKQTQINEAMAMARLGSVQISQGEHKQAAATFKQAAAIFQKFRAAGDHSEPVIYGLALIRGNQGWDAMNTQVGSTQPLVESVDLLRPLATGKHPSKRVLHLYADSLNGVCLSRWFAGDAKQALPSCSEALKVLDGLGARTLKDLDAAASWANTAFTETYVLPTLNRAAEAQRIGAEGYALTEKILAQRPDDAGSLSNRTNLAAALATLAAQQHDLPTALKWVDKSVAAGHEGVRFDPASLKAWTDVASVMLSGSYIQFAHGDIAQAITTLREAAAMEDDPRVPKGFATVGMYVWQNLASMQGLAGDQAGAQASVRRALRDSDAAVAGLPANSPQRALAAAFHASFPAQTALYAGNAKVAWTGITAAINKLEAIHIPASDANAIASRNGWFGVARSIAVMAALRLGRYANAERIARQQLAAPVSALFDAQSTYTGASVDLAHATAMQGRKPEARKTLQPALDYYASQAKAGATSTDFRGNYARALYVSAISQPDTAAGRKQRAADLAAAQAQLDGMSKEARQLVTTLRTARLIADARAGHDH